MTSKTSALAVDIAGDKDVTRQLLASAGLPVPRGEIVRSEDEAIAAAERIGFPVVTKPLDGNHGRGVGLDLRKRRDVRAGFKRAVAEARRGQVVVESYVTGNDYRVLVVGGRMVAVAERVPAHVIGDGEHTVAELVELANQDPRRGHRAREGPHADQGRRRRGRAAAQAGATRWTTCRRRARS